MTFIDRLINVFAPSRAFQRAQARRALEILSAPSRKRHYEAAQSGRRTSGFNRSFGDANTVNARALVELRLHARDLARNNAWAERGLEVITGNTVSWGIVPKPVGSAAREASVLWKQWAETAECDAAGMLPFAGLQEMVLRTVAESGEALVRRRWRRPVDGLAIPMQIEILEPDFLDTGKDGIEGVAGGKIIQGIEFDKIGRRVAYWLYPEHPGSGWSTGISRRVSASEILHVYRPKRPGQVRGISWLAQTVMPLKDFDEYEDATLVRQKIAACFAAFVEDDGTSANIGDPNATDDEIETFEPGTISYLTAGKKVSFSNPPTVTADGFDTRTLRRIASGMGITYEELTGDFSGVNFSSARMARLAHWQNVYKWRYNMLIPQFCQGVWAWAMEVAETSGLLPEAPIAEWSCPPMPMIEPDKEGLALTRLVRSGVMTPSEMVREQGGDPETHWEEYAADMKTLDALKIKLDSDVRAVSQAGLTQERGGGGPEGGPPKPAAKEEDRAAELAPPEDLDVEISDEELP